MAQEICLPRLGWSMEEGIFVGWLKQDGDEVRTGEPLFELEGEKGLQEVEATDAGILRIPPSAPKEGSTLAVGALLGYLVAAGEAPPWEAGDASSASIADATAPMAPVVCDGLAEAESNGHARPSLNPDPTGRAEAPKASSAPHALPAGSRLNDSVTSSPRARRVAGELGIDWRQLQGTGAQGRIREADIRLAAQTTQSEIRNPKSAIPSPQLPAPSPSPIPLSPRRKTIAARMLASSQQTAPVTLTTRCDATNLVALRQQFKDAGGIVPSYSDIAIKLVALVLKQQPELGARWVEGGLHMPSPETLDIGIAVDTEQGLVVPVVRRAAQVSLVEIAVESKRLIDEARRGRLSAADSEGGVFTVTNLGPYGIDAFTPIINLPQTAILGLGAIRREPVVKTGDLIAICEMMTISLTFDHRAIDAPAARFLQKLSSAFVNPAAWLLGLKGP